MNKTTITLILLLALILLLGAGWYYVHDHEELARGTAQPTGIAASTSAPSETLSTSTSIISPVSSSPVGTLTHQPETYATVITQANTNQTIHVKLGSRFLLSLGTLNWTVSLSDPGIIDLVSHSTSQGFQNVYTAHKSGVTTLTAEGRPVCKAGEMCAQYIVEFNVIVVVEP